jgi:hypothetical protein
MRCSAAAQELQARFVANATAEITASRIDPPIVPSPPPTACASKGEAALPAEVLIWLPSPVGTSAAAPKPSTNVIR